VTDGRERDAMDETTRLAAIGAALAHCGAGLRVAALATGLAAIASGVLLAHLRLSAWVVVLTVTQAALLASGLYLGLRTGLDADLFAELLRAPDTAAFDAAMVELGLLSSAKSGRSFSARIAGVKRLLSWQALALAAQIVLFLGLLAAGGAA